jgi:Cu(I)/Ag(I) efflux system membrane protein CusA/SilA
LAARRFEFLKPAFGSSAIVAESGVTTTRGAVADLAVADGPPEIRSENARLNGSVYVDISGRYLGSYVEEVQRRVVPKLKTVVSFTLAIILVLL